MVFKQYLLRHGCAIATCRGHRVQSDHISLILYDKPISTKSKYYSHLAEYDKLLNFHEGNVTNAILAGKHYML